MSILLKLKYTLFPPQPPTAQGGKDFSAELEKFASMIEHNQSFAFARFNDGEMKIVFGDIFDIAKNRIGNTYVPDDQAAEQQRLLLQQALKFKAPNYYVGIVCPCCENEEDFYRMKALSGQDEHNLTWANVFVNANYPAFQSRITPLFQRRSVVFIGNCTADCGGLPFKVTKQFAVGDNAWVNDYERLLAEMINYLKDGSVKNTVFIFCAGVLSNLLIHKLYEQYPDNTYLDLGSVYDIELGLGKSRRYLRKGKTLYKTCIWGTR